MVISGWEAQYPSTLVGRAGQGARTRRAAVGASRRRPGSIVAAEQHSDEMSTFVTEIDPDA
jgi:hypothetical protein